MQLIIDSNEMVVNGYEVEYTLVGRDVVIDSVDGNEDFSIDFEEEIEMYIRNKYDNEFQGRLLEYYTGNISGEKGYGLRSSGKKYVDIGFITLRIADHGASPDRMDRSIISIVTHKFDKTENKFMDVNYDISDVESVDEAVSIINDLVKERFADLIDEKLDDDVYNKSDLDDVFETIYKIKSICRGGKKWFSQYSNYIEDILEILIDDGVVSRDDVYDLIDYYDLELDV